MDGDLQSLYSFPYRCLLAFLLLLLEELIAGNGQGGHQHHKLVEVHLVVFVHVQVVHDFLHEQWILLSLRNSHN